MKIFQRSKIFYVSPWLLAAATALLVLIVVTFTLNNIRREEHLMTAALLQKADTLIRIVHSGSRSAYFSDLRRDIRNAEPWYEYVQRVVDHVAEDPDVKFLVVADETRKVVAHNKPEMIGKQVVFELPDNKQVGQKITPPQYRIANLKNEGRVFEAVRQYFPYRPFMEALLHNGMGHGQGKGGGLGPRGMMLRRLHEQGEIEKLDNRSFYILVGLDMESYDTSLRRVKLQTIGLSLVMLLVGLGGWLSLVTVQGYRVSQQTLGEMKLFTSLLLAKLPVGIIASDREGYITTFNDSAARMTGLTRDKAFGQKIGTILPGPFAELFKVLNDNQEALSSGATLDKEITIQVAGKMYHYFCQIISIEEEDAEHQGWVLLISDLTRIKDLEKEMRENERLAAVGRMAAGVAHEVRNPLSSIKGLALLLKGKFAEKSQDSKTAGLLVDQVDRMNRTVSELLSFARPTPLQLEKVSVKELLQDIMRLMETDAHNSNILFHLDIAPNLPDIAGDRDRLSQVFINLLLNAVQAMEEGGELRIEAKNGEDGRHAEILVRDTGCGIPPDIMSQLFYPYFTTKVGGTGIGLAISQKIINDHKGTIKIDSIEGSGTTVTVVLPVYSGKGTEVHS